MSERDLVSPPAASAFHAFELAGWRSAAAAYTDGFAPLTSQAAGPLLDAADAGEGTRLLDVACGPGDVCALAAEREALATGVDFSPEMLTVACRRHPRLEFHKGDAQALPFGDDGFDAVTMSFLLGHLSDPGRALSEAFRVLAVGGHIALSWWATFDRAVGFDLIFRALRAHGQMEVGLPEGLPFEHFSDPGVTCAALGASGFSDPEVRLLDLTWRPSSGAAVFETFVHGSVRTAGVLRAQTPEALAAIRSAVIEGAKAYERDDGLAIPMPAWVFSARRA